MATKLKVFVCALASLCGSYQAGLHAQDAADAADAATRTDIAAVYTAFIKAWSGSAPMNVARSAEPVDKQDASASYDCEQDQEVAQIRKLPSYPLKDLASVLGHPSNIRLVDPKTWRPDDPGRLIENGQPVGDAVQKGIGQGLMTLSAISFNAKHDTAVFTYSFVCGSLCGHGGVVIFHKTAKGWVQGKADCGSWIS